MSAVASRNVRGGEFAFGLPIDDVSVGNGAFFFFLVSSSWCVVVFACLFVGLPGSWVLAGIASRGCIGIALYERLG